MSGPCLSFCPPTPADCQRSSSHRQLLRDLAQRIEQIEARPQKRSALTLDQAGLGEVLPALPAGSLVELLSGVPGAGAWTLSLLLAAHACERRALVVADLRRSFYLPAAAKLGVDLGRTIILRPRSWPDACAAIEQSLRCPAVGAVLGRCQALQTVDLRRLQLAAEAGGGLGLLLLPSQFRRVPSFAALRLLVSPVSTGEPRLRRFRVEVLRCRGGKEGQSVILEIDNETGHVCLPAALANSTGAARRTRATG
jgi:protein ImuA